MTYLQPPLPGMDAELALAGHAPAVVETVKQALLSRFPDMLDRSMRDCIRRAWEEECQLWDAMKRAWSRPHSQVLASSVACRAVAFADSVPVLPSFWSELA